MKQLQIGQYINKKRKEKNLTQEQLAEVLSVSNKTISKWENGKCMPDYSIVEKLCDALEITIAELMDGEDAEPNSLRLYDETLILNLMKKTAELENQKNTVLGLLIMVMGFALLALSFVIGGSSFKEFISGLLLGISIAEMLVGIYLTAKNFANK